jgi:hypothetical protein
MNDAEYFLEKAEQCFRLAAFARGHVLSLDINRGIEALGDEFMNKAVEIESARQRAETAQARSRNGGWELVVGREQAKVSVSGPLRDQGHQRSASSSRSAPRRHLRLAYKVGEPCRT